MIIRFGGGGGGGWGSYFGWFLEWWFREIFLSSCYRYSFVVVDVGGILLKEGGMEGERIDDWELISLVWLGW